MEQSDRIPPGRQRWRDSRGDLSLGEPVLFLRLPAPPREERRRRVSVYGAPARRAPRQAAPSRDRREVMPRPGRREMMPRPGRRKMTPRRPPAVCHSVPVPVRGQTRSPWAGHPLPPQAGTTSDPRPTTSLRPARSRTRPVRLPVRPPGSPPWTACWHRCARVSTAIAPMPGATRTVQVVPRSDGPGTDGRAGQ